jgi:hypothetical protein
MKFLEHYLELLAMKYADVGGYRGTCFLLSNKLAAETNCAAFGIARLHSGRKVVYITYFVLRSTK